MDFIVVVSGCITMLPFLTPGADHPKQVDTLDLRTLRAVRVLRPLKLVSGIPSKSYRSSRLMSMSFPTVQVCKSFSSPFSVRWRLSCRSDCLCSSRLSYLLLSGSNSIQEPFIRPATTNEAKSRTSRKNRFHGQREFTHEKTIVFWFCTITVMTRRTAVECTIAMCLAPFASTNGTGRIMVGKFFRTQCFSLSLSCPAKPSKKIDSEIVFF